MSHQPKMQSIEHDIKTMAEQLCLPISEVHHIVWSEIHNLEREARINDFIPLLAVKQVKESLHRKEMRSH